MDYRFFWAQWGILNVKQTQWLLRHFGSFEAAWNKVTPEFLLHLGLRDDKIRRAFERRQADFFADSSKVKRHLGVQVYFFEDEAYPPFLKQISNPPPFLFVRGILPPFHKSISVVGTRSVTPYGKRVTEKLTADLVRGGFVVVSGLALGVDALAHRSTLQVGGITLAVLGSGVDQIYPRSHYRLAQEIIETGGALLSSYPLGTLPEPYHFPQRNEIVAGLTRGTLVTEGGVKSGALITAKLALDYGREVFAVPNAITHLGLSGTNHLIRNGFAKLVENTTHIMEDFGLKSGNQALQVQDFSMAERSILEKLSLEAKTMDQLFEDTEFDIPQLSELLLHLQLKGAIALQGERWVLA